MKLTKKLFSFLHRVFDKDPAPFLALRLRYAGPGMTWSIADARLTTMPVGGIGGPLSVDLTNLSIGQLVVYLASQPGYTVEYADRSELSLLGAAVLLDGSGDQNKSNGDHLRGYTNVLWSYMEANANELQQAGDQIGEMLRQMNTKTAEGVWLDELGGYYGVPRLQGEQDGSYGARIIAEVLRPRGNNVAIEAAISAYTGQSTKVTDVNVNSPIRPIYDATVTYNGAERYNSVSSPLYGLFDVEYGYDVLQGDDIAEFAEVVRGLIDRLRDAGTHLRALSLTGSILDDTVDPFADNFSVIPAVTLDDIVGTPDDGSMAVSIPAMQMDDLVPGPVETDTITYSFTHTYSGARFYNGSSSFNSGYAVSGSSLTSESSGTAELIA